MTLFHEDGHLTQTAFEALLQGEPLDDLERLEISEHLSFCDACVEKYTDLLDSELLLSPQAPVASTVLQRIREKTRRIFVNKYATVAAAASFAILFWNLGIFNIDVSQGNGRMLDALTNSATSISQKTTKFSDNLVETLNKIVNSMQYERGANHEKK